MSSHSSKMNWECFHDFQGNWDFQQKQLGHQLCQGVLSRLPNELEDYYTRVCVKNKKVNIDISQAPNKMWANAFSIYIFTQPAAFQCVFLWRKKHLKVYNMNGTIIHFKSQWYHCTRYLLLCENGLISYQVTVGGENF